MKSGPLAKATHALYRPCMLSRLFIILIAAQTGLTAALLAPALVGLVEGALVLAVLLLLGGLLGGLLEGIGQGRRRLLLISATTAAASTSAAALLLLHLGQHLLLDLEQFELRHLQLQQQPLDLLPPLQQLVQLHLLDLLP